MPACAPWRACLHAPSDAHAPPRRATPAVARIALVKPDKARGVEDMIIAAARRGALGEKVTEERLIDLLEQVNERTAAKTKVTIQRRRAFDDDDF